MPTMLMSTRRARPATFALLAGLTAALGACADGAGVADSVAPGMPGGDRPARVAVAASVSYSAAAAAEVRVTARYRLQGGALAPLSTQSITLTDVPSQQVPISLDLANCLRDATRAGLGSAAAAADECVVQLELQLFLDGVSVDRQLVGPLSLRPGQTSTITEPVPLSDIAEVRLTAPPANVVTPGQPLRVEVARTMALTAQVLDRTGRTLTGRTPVWNSSAPSVATVSATGVVTAIAPGAARITAEVGNRQASVDVRVVPPPQVLTVVAAGISGGGRVTSAPAGVDCVVNGTQTTGVCTFTFPGDIQAVLTATPASGSELVGWSGDCAGTQGAACTLSMAQPRTAGIVFRARRSLNVTALGGGIGSVASDLGGIVCVMQAGTTSGPCSATYLDGTVVTLSATAAGSSVFRGWSGDCAGVSGPVCQLTMNANRTATARFEAPVSVSISGTGLGNGLITSSPTGLSCSLQGSNGSGACTALFIDGTSITLTANASSGSTFRGWGGDCATASGTTCTLLVTGGSKAVTARFDPPATLSVIPSGTGDGQVFAGNVISCLRANTANSGTCSATVANGTILTLTALPDGESQFTGWTGACSGTSLCQVTMDQARTVGAVFTRRQVQLTLTLTGPGFGNVRLNNGFTCTLAEGESSKECVTFVDVSRQLTLTATPAQGQVFSSYSGLCTSSSAVCTFIVTGPSSITATFGLATGTVFVAPASTSTGNGVVYTSTESISCSMTGTSVTTQSTCSLTVPSGTQITLFAAASSGSSFTEWGGGCASAGSNSTCTITATGNVSVTARFALVPTVTVAVSLTGAGGIMQASGSGFSETCTRPTGSIAPTTACSWSIPQGQSFGVTLLGLSGSVGTFNSSSLQLCYMVSSPCTVGGLTNGNSIAAVFTVP
ncbi:MAG: InlB B-repeat-containing protein [Gemmatimonadaceae bacterium]